MRPLRKLLRRRLRGKDSPMIYATRDATVVAVLLQGIEHAQVLNNLPVVIGREQLPPVSVVPLVRLEGNRELVAVAAAKRP